MKNHGLLWAASALGLAAGAAAAVQGLTDVMIRSAVDRELPWLARVSRGNRDLVEENGRRFPEIKQAAIALASSKHEVVSITAGTDGASLVGHWFPHPEPRRIMIAMHGWRSAWYKDFSMSNPFWTENGCAILYAEQRGMNESGGEKITFGLQERYDCLDWAAWAHQRYPELPVYLAGISMGGATVLMAAGEVLPPYIHGIMDDCGFTSPEEILCHVAKEYLHVSGPLSRSLMKRDFRRLTGLEADSASAVTAMENCTVPVLFIHGEEDRFVPPEMTRAAYEACRAPKRLLLVPGAEHGLSYLVDRPGYEKAVLDFWRDFD